MTLYDVRLFVKTDITQYMYGADRFKPLKTQTSATLIETSRHQLGYTTDKRKFTIYIQYI